jgi:hypothetical protein
MCKHKKTYRYDMTANHETGSFGDIIDKIDQGGAGGRVASEHEQLGSEVLDVFLDRCQLKHRLERAFVAVSLRRRAPVYVCKIMQMSTISQQNKR